MKRLSFLFFCFSSLFVWGVNYTHQLGVALMFQNEAKHLKEWIEYHKMVGVDHFYLFNNLSDDNFLEVIDPYLKSGEAELFHFPNPSNSQEEYLVIQRAIYNHALHLARRKVKWLAFIDADEYIVPLEGDSLLKSLKPFEKYGGVYINWLNFGTSHVEKIGEDKLRIEELLYSADAPNFLGKSIVRPDRVLCCKDPHIMTYKAPFFHVNTSFRWFPTPVPGIESNQKMLVFHYYTGDLDFLINIKFPRRKKWVPGIELTSYIESMEPLNSSHNKTMLRFVPRLRNQTFR